MRYFHLIAILLALAIAGGTLISPHPARAASAAEISRDAQSALKTLYVQSAAARTLGEKAKGILVFPGIVKGGFLAGGQFGEGALIKDGKTAGYYNTPHSSLGTCHLSFV
jgi:lipid-binding SYLF domain-containing protein